MRPNNIIIIGSSAGGPRILKELFTGFPRINAAIVIVQHMPEFINMSFTGSLNECTDMNVILAEHGDHLESGSIYIAPSSRHLVLRNNTQVQLIDGEKINFVCPAVDATLMSLKPEPGINFIGVILTGMGRDGASGISYIKRMAGITIAQDEKTSIIYGMPKEAFATGDIDFVLSTEMIKTKLIALAK